MQGWGRLAAVPAALAVAAILSVPAAAGTPSSDGDLAAMMPAQDPQPAGAEPQRVGADGATADAAESGVEVVRYAGSDAYEQSVEIARALVDAGGGSSEWAVLTSGESWAEAAAAGPLAASLGAPVLLVPPGGLQSTTARPDLVEFLKSARVRRVAIVGSPNVLPNHEPSVLFGLGMLPRNIERIHSDDPVGTSIAIAERIGAPAEFGELGRTAIIASDQSVADAVAVGPLAAAGPFPLLHTAPDTLDHRITAYLTEHKVIHVVLVGGTAAIAPAVQQAIETADIAVTHLAGRDRRDTARLAAGLFNRHTGDDPVCADGPGRIGLAPAQYPELALVAGPLLSQHCAPLRYASPEGLPADLRNTLYLARHRAEVTKLLLFAGAEQISVETLDGPATSTPPFRLAFEHFFRQDGQPRVGIAIVDENHRMEIHAGDAGLVAFDWLSWSLDGQYLAFQASQTGGRTGLFLLDTATGSYRRLTPESQEFYFSTWASPVWSPDGRRLAMSAYVWKYGEDGKPLEDQNEADLYVLDLNTGLLEQLTSSIELDHFKSWSPDSRYILYERTRTNALPLGLAPPGDEFYVMDVERGAVNRLDLGGKGIFDFQWSPTGDTAAAELVEPNDFNYSTASIAIADTTSLPSVTIEDSGQKGHLYSWSHDGKYLVLVSDYTAERSLSVVNVQFESVTELSLPGARGKRNYALFHGWSPTSYQVLLEGFHSLTGSTGELVLVDVETGLHSALQIPEPRLYFNELTFSPDGSQIGAVIYDHETAGRRIMLYRGPSGAIPVELIDISDYAPPTEQITSVRIRWSDVGILGTITWHYDF